MNANWQRFLAVRGARFEADRILDFGDAESEMRAAAAATVLAPLTDSAVIRATGEDASAFLHNLLSNDIQHLGADAALRCGFCSAKGRLLADFLVWREARDYLLQLSSDIAPAMLSKLGMYILRAKVKLAAADDDLVLLGLAGGEAPALLRDLGGEVPPEPLRLIRFAAGSAIRLDANRFQLVLRADAAEAAWELLAGKAQPAGTPAWRWLEVAAGVPHITGPTQEAFVPQMANLDLLGGVSFTKGCYPGQEVVARTRYLGKVKRRTYRARVEGGCPAAGTDLFSTDLPDQSCGQVIQAAPAPTGGSELLASMLMSSAESGDVRLGSPQGPQLVFLPLPYPLS